MQRPTGPPGRAESLKKGAGLARRVALEGMHPVWGPVSIALAVLGVVWYLVFGLVNGHPTDVGVYSVTVMLLGFGLAGIWASRAMVQADA